jgi:hypothetical protein
MAWSDAARKAAATKRAMQPPRAKIGPVAAVAPTPQSPHANNQKASHERGYFRQKMPK